MLSEEETVHLFPVIAGSDHAKIRNWAYTQGMIARSCIDSRKEVHSCYECTKCHKRRYSLAEFPIRREDEDNGRVYNVIYACECDDRYGLLNEENPESHYVFVDTDSLHIRTDFHGIIHTVIPNAVIVSKSLSPGSRRKRAGKYVLTDIVEPTVWKDISAYITLSSS